MLSTPDDAPSTPAVAREPLRQRAWRGYVHPWPLAALALLVVNDHLLKGAGLLPDWLTGKLSDFAGLFFFPLLLVALVALVRRGGPRRLDLTLACLLTGALFAAIQLAPAAADAYRDLGAAVAALVGPLWRARPTVTADPTDLVALPVLVLAWLHGRRFLRPLANTQSDS